MPEASHRYHNTAAACLSPLFEPKLYFSLLGKAASTSFSCSCALLTRSWAGELHVPSGVTGEMQQVPMGAPESPWASAAQPLHPQGLGPL